MAFETVIFVVTGIILISAAISFTIYLVLKLYKYYEKIQHDIGQQEPQIDTESQQIQDQLHRIHCHTRENTIQINNPPSYSDIFQQTQILRNNTIPNQIHHSTISINSTAV